MPSWQALFLIGWAGLRGIVSLAAAMALPLTLADGTPLPFRSELILLTFIAIFCTLVLQGLSLAPLVRWLRIPPVDDPAREELRARSQAARSALLRLDELEREPWAEPSTLTVLRGQYEDRLRRAAEAETGDGAASLLAERVAKRARFESLLAERTALVGLRREQAIGDEILVALESELDLEAARHGLADLRGAEALEERA
jgi:CPA1 family monovalent cation:H+ antiporter